MIRSRDTPRLQEATMTLLRPLAVQILLTSTLGCTAAAQGRALQPTWTVDRLAKALDTGDPIVLNDVQFDSGTSTLAPSAIPTLKVVSDVLKRDRTLTLEIQDDSVAPGAPAASLEAARARANAVREYMINTLGVAQDRVIVTDARLPAGAQPQTGNAQPATIQILKVGSADSRDGQQAPPTIASARAGGEWTGQITTGMMAIGGETTGIILSTGREAFELQPANDTLRQRLRELSGKTATVRGTLQVRPGIEVRSRSIITVTEIIPK
jgi:outer membrane protein OmpA-like peptidoglycan-associated protein